KCSLLNPKSESRNPKEIRDPKPKLEVASVPERMPGSVARDARACADCADLSAVWVCERHLSFGNGIWDFFRSWDFRSSDFDLRAGPPKMSRILTQGLSNRHYSPSM